MNRQRTRKSTLTCEEKSAMAGARKTPRHTPKPLDLWATCEAMVAKHTTAEIASCGYFRGHPIVQLEGEDGEYYADDLTPTVDVDGESIERPCVQCGTVAEPDGPDPCLGMLPGVRAACCGHGVDEPYVMGHWTVRGQQALDYFAHYGVGSTEDEACPMGPSPLSGSRCEPCHEAPVREYLIALTQGWTVRVDPWWYPRLRGYRWQARVAGRGGRWRYAGRSLRTPRGQVCVAMARVILGCQAVDTGEVLRPGKAGLWEMPDLATQRIDLREQNLFVGSAQDILRHRRKQQQGASSQYIGVSYHRGRQCWQAYVRVQGRLSRVGEFPTEREAAQARDQRVLALGLSPLVRLNFPGEHERSPRAADARDAARRKQL